MSWAKVGAKCVCIDGAPYSGDGVYIRGHVNELPVRGVIYTITNVLGDDGQGVIRIALKGAPNINAVTGKDDGWGMYRFRPLVAKTIEQDVQMFKRIAETTPSLENAE